MWPLPQDDGQMCLGTIAEREHWHGQYTHGNCGSAGGDMKATDEGGRGSRWT